MNTVFQLSIESECLIFRVKELDDVTHLNITFYHFVYPAVQVHEFHLFTFSVLFTLQ